MIRLGVVVPGAGDGAGPGDGVPGQVPHVTGHCSLTDCSRLQSPLKFVH